jgi:hypothetical protein
MYHIYMPVDMVLAISHSRMTRERERNRLERLKKSECVLDNVVYSKHTDTGNDINIEKVKYQSCLEMFRLW